MPSGAPDKVVLHPLVLLSVVDHYNRVARDTKKRVLGVLLGDLHKGTVDVSNSFAGEQQRVWQVVGGCMQLGRSMLLLCLADLNQTRVVPVSFSVSVSSSLP